MLEKCGFDLNSRTQVKAYIDIAPTCAHVLSHGDCELIDLKRMCQLLRMRTTSYHNAAHDAMYTLQVLLELFCCYKREQLASHYAMLPICPDEKAADTRTLWECQLECLAFITKNAGDAFLVASRKCQWRIQHLEEHLCRTDQPPEASKLEILRIMKTPGAQPTPPAKIARCPTVLFGDTIHGSQRQTIRSLVAELYGDLFWESRLI
jgi:hypothetical protein